MDKVDTFAREYDSDIGITAARRLSVTSPFGLIPRQRDLAPVPLFGEPITYCPTGIFLWPMIAPNYVENGCAEGVISARGDYPCLGSR
jgi:hypothetical protein